MEFKKHKDTKAALGIGSYSYTYHVLSVFYTSEFTPRLISQSSEGIRLVFLHKLYPIDRYLITCIKYYNDNKTDPELMTKVPLESFKGYNLLFMGEEFLI